MKNFSLFSERWIAIERLKGDLESIGPHEIVFRHPELGEQRQAVSISLKAPARLSVDMRKQP